VRLPLSGLSALAGAALVLTVAACNSAPTSPTVVPFTQVDVRPGTGATAASGDTVTVNYTGWLYSATAPDQKGLQFDTTTGRGTFSFLIGAGQVIQGWDEGVAGMQAGGLRRLIIPPNMAYGSVRVGAIPPYSTLVFEIELVTVGVASAIVTQPSAQTVSPGATGTFTISATGTPAPTYQWQVSTDNGSTFINLVDSATYAGTTTATLTVTAASGLNGYQFRCIVTNTAGSATSSAAILTVK